MARIGTVIREVYHRPGSPSAWQFWLACGSAGVHQGFFPRREYVTALATAVRAHSGRPA
jgi:hypothetical protein